MTAATYSGRPNRNLPAAELASALAATGREFSYDDGEQFYATRDAVLAGELGVNLIVKGGVAEFLLVVRTPAGHVGGPFPLLMRQAERRFGPPLPPTKPYPQPWYRDGEELRRVLLAGFALYAEVAGAVVASGLLGGPSAAADAGGRP